ncbi:unnamed protein product [Paramecium octaurelia]|uniref:B box-type domain-containing protein n=1 Tax=Paramecium octaurelia TaxID=43137 RepID=A0A8S1W0G4_PAROT|nr:unnamed protein product [Paramecium octaurelia]
MSSIQRQPRSRIFEQDSQRPSDRPITPSQQQSTNNKIRQLTHNTQLTTPIVQCHYHPDQFIQNFCKHLDCLLPLCPACVNIHQEDHNNQQYAPTFDHLSTCLTEQQNKIVDICNLLADDIQNVTELKTIINEHHKTQKNKFLEAKEKLYQSIDNYLSTLESTLNTQSQKQIDYLLNQVNQFHRLSYERWNHLQTRLQKLDSDKCLKTLIKCYKQSKPEDIYSQQHEMSLQFTDQIKAKLNQIQINPTSLQNIMDQLHLYIQLVTEQQNQPLSQQIRKSYRPSSQQHAVSTSPIDARIKENPIQQRYVIPRNKVELSIPQIQQGFLPQSQGGINYFNQAIVPLNVQQTSLNNILPLPFRPSVSVKQIINQIPQTNALQRVMQIQVNKKGEVINLKSSRPRLKTTEKYQNRIFNENDFSPKLNMT